MLHDEAPTSHLTELGTPQALKMRYISDKHLVTPENARSGAEKALAQWLTNLDATGLYRRGTDLFFEGQTSIGRLELEALSDFQALSDVDVASDPLFFRIGLGELDRPDAWSITEPAAAQLQLISTSSTGMRGTLLGGHTHQVVWSFLNHFSAAARLTPTERRVLFWHDCWKMAERRLPPGDERFKGGKALLAGIGWAYFGGLLVGIPLGVLFGELGVLAGVGGSALTGAAFALRVRTPRSTLAERSLVNRLDARSCFDSVTPARGPKLAWSAPTLVRGRERQFESAELVKGRRVNAVASSVGLTLELEVFRWTLPKEAHPAAAIVPPTFAVYRVRPPQDADDHDLDHLLDSDESGDFVDFLDETSLHDASFDMVLNEVERLMIGSNIRGPYR